jgi:hypothetical protein
MMAARLSEMELRPQMFRSGRARSTASCICFLTCRSSLLTATRRSHAPVSLNTCSTAS